MNGFHVSSVAVRRVGFVRKVVECKESRIGKQPITVPSNVTLTMEGQDLKVKGPLGEMAITYPREVKLEREEEGVLRVRKAMETRRANQMHGLFRYSCSFDHSVFLIFSSVSFLLMVNML